MSHAVPAPRFPERGEVLIPVLLVLALSTGESSLPPPGEGLSLLPNPPREIRAAPGRAVPPAVPAPVPLSAAAAATAVTGWRARRGRRGEGLAGGPPGEATVVVVGGYGSNGDEAFDELIGLMAIEPSRVRSFDYRWIVPGDRQPPATRRTEVDDLAGALNAYLAGLGREEGRIYLIGHSKGAVAIAELLARWDRHPALRVPEVEGAALLEPPLAGGPLGLLQSAGTLIGLPNDGGYGPRPWPGGPDRRAHLGRRAGVEVVVFRNPKAAVTTFWRRPAGLRVLDVPDGGAHALEVLVRPDPVPMRRWMRFLWRVQEAHRSVLGDERVARCVALEIREPGSCRSVPEGW